MIYFVYYVIIVAFLDTFSQLPIMSPFAQSVGASSFLTGLIVGMYSLANMGGNVLAGVWIDQFGRKKILLIGMIFVSICLIGYSVIETANQLLVIRLIHGIGGGLLVPAAYAFLGDRTTDQSRGKSMAFSGACVGISAIIGPAFGGIASEHLGVGWVFIIISILFAVTAILVAFIMKDDYKVDKRERDSISIKQIIQLIKHPSLINAYCGAFALLLTLGILAYMLPLKITDADLNFSYSGLLISTFGIVAIFIFLLPTNRIFDIVKRETLIMIGMCIVAVALFILSSTENIIILFIAMSIFGSGFAFIFPSATALVIDHSQENERGRAFGLFYGFFSLGVVTGSFVLGALNVTPNHGLAIGAITMIFFVSFLFWKSKAKVKQLQT